MSNFAHRGKYGQKGNLRRAYQLGVKAGLRAMPMPTLDIPALSRERKIDKYQCSVLVGEDGNHIQQMPQEQRFLHAKHKLAAGIPAWCIGVTTKEHHPGVTMEIYTLEVLRP